MNINTDKGQEVDVIPEHDIEALARCILPQIREFFDSPEAQAAFEEWKREQERS